jgi:hypothetical protein
MDTKGLALAPLALGVVTALAAGQLLLGAEGLAAFRAQRDGVASREENVVTIRDVSELRPGTEAERARAQYFNGYGAEINAPGSALEILRAGSSRFALPERAVPVPPPGFVSPTEAELRREGLAAAVCRTQLVLLGQASSAKVMLSEAANTLFTDHSVQIERWLKPAAGASRATFSSQGAVVRMAGRVSQVDTTANLPLRERMIFFAADFNTSDQRDAFRLLGWSSIQHGDVATIARQVPLCPAR